MTGHSPISPEQALEGPRRVGVRLQLDRPVPELTSDTIGLLLRVLSRHGVVCLVDQQGITPAELRAFAARWGEVIELPAGMAFDNQEPGQPSITRVGNVRPDGSVAAGVSFGEYWHHDGDFWPPGENFIVNFLSSAVLPTKGGETGFLDLRLAYENLSDAQRSKLSGAYIRVRASEISDFENASSEELPPDVEHPVFHPHPVNREIALYLPESSSGIQSADGRSLGPVAELVNLIERDQGMVLHRWLPGDLLITDNLQVMHRSMGGYGNSPRLLYRCQARVAGGRIE